ncbi:MULTISPECIES: GntR family transcriptional regulator [unclassified Mycolicibacterium]|uniref:GntR family transcriptional regulator n=1 Tax=unclassified Mycolicibacterium TaxID=2636767 RepID=UPI002EDAB44A
MRRLARKMPDLGSAMIALASAAATSAQQKRREHISGIIANEMADTGVRAIDADGRTVALGRGAEGKQIAVEQLREAVRDGRFAPGQRLVEAELVEQFGVTRGSARAAIDELITEGLLERIPNRGARVRTVSAEQAIEILECRKALEGLIAAKAAERLTEIGAARLRDCATGLTTSVEQGDLLKYSQLNQELHAVLIEIAEQQAASDLIRRLNAQVVRHQFRLSLQPGRPQVSLSEHLAVLEAVLARDPQAAEQAMRDHLDGVIAALRDSV